MSVESGDSGEPQARIRVLLVEDHPAVREGVAALLERDGGCEVVGRAATGAEALQLARALQPAVVVLDLMLGAGDGLVLLKEFAAQVPASRVLVFTLQPEDTYAVRCLRAGARGYVMKDAPVAAFYAAVRAVAAGELRFSATVTQGLLAVTQTGGRRPAGLADQLSDRELHVFRLTGLARPTREIAAELGVSVKTVEAHRENIKNKLGVHSYAALTARAAAWLRENAQG